MNEILPLSSISSEFTLRSPPFPLWCTHRGCCLTADGCCLTMATGDNDGIINPTLDLACVCGQVRALLVRWPPTRPSNSPTLPSNSPTAPHNHAPRRARVLGHAGATVSALAARVSPHDAVL
jgi:hypothetical protein